MEEILWTLSHSYLKIEDWKKLARIWNFTEEHIQAIEHQYIDKSSYKEQSYRMMLIWLQGLLPSQNSFKEILNSLIAIEKKNVAMSECLNKKTIYICFHFRKN